MVKKLFSAAILVFVIAFLLPVNASAGESPRWIFGDVFDNEAGVMIYLSAGVVNAVVVAEPNVAFENLTNKRIGKVERYVDRERGVVLYRYCSGFAWFSCGVGAVKLK
jgi:hypothetical protein